MANSNLTAGAIERIMTGAQVDSPILQVLGQKRIAGNTGSGGADRYRLLLSDGVNSHSSAMLATQLNDKVDSGELSQFAVIRLVKYLCNQIQPDRRVVIVLDMEVIERGEDVGSKIGQPVQYKAGQASVQQQQAPVQPVAPAPVQPMQNAMKENKIPGATKKEDAWDDDEMFLRSCLPYFKQLAPQQKMETRIEFMQILMRKQYDSQNFLHMQQLFPASPLQPSHLSAASPLQPSHLSRFELINNQRNVNLPSPTQGPQPVVIKPEVAFRNNMPNMVGSLNLGTNENNDVLLVE